MNKINLLLIDDNPKFCWLSLNDAIQLGFLKNDGYTVSNLRKKIPAIINDAPNDESSHWKDINKYFNLKWLQSPLDVKEFCDLSSEIENRFTSLKLGERGFVPEIICFDYALSDNMDNSYYDCESDRNILSKINPNYLLADFFSSELKEEKTLYRHQDDVPLNYKIESQSSGDNMGCYAGGIVAFMFRNTPCSSVPVTFKTKDKVQGKEAGYFEWLLHNELDEVFDWESRGDDKSWYTIIKIATKNLRKRIKKLIQSRKIIPKYEELLSLSIGENENTGGVFTFTSIYGIRELPLDGLFIEFNNEIRSAKISEWAGEVLEILYHQTQYSLSTDSLKNASLFSKDLWDSYRDTSSVLKRLKISELNYLLSMDDLKFRTELKMTPHESIDELRAEFQSEFDVLSAELGIKPIKKTKDEYTYELELGVDIRNGSYNRIEKRWAALIVMLRLHHHYLSFCFANSDEKTNKHLFLRTEPDEKDYYIALFPIAQTPITTLIHKTDGENFKNSLKRQTCYKGSKDGDFGLELKSILNCISNENGILSSEKHLIRSIAKNEKEFPLYKDENNLPKWLKFNI